jgi:hypothetical protein
MIFALKLIVAKASHVMTGMLHAFQRMNERINVMNNNIAKETRSNFFLLVLIDKGIDGFMGFKKL